MQWKAIAQSAKSLRGCAPSLENTRKKFQSDQERSISARESRESQNFCDRDNPNPSVLVLSHVATCLTAGLAIIRAVLAKAHIVRPEAMRAVPVTITASFVLVALQAGELFGHWVSL